MNKFFNRKVSKEVKKKKLYTVTVTFWQKMLTLIELKIKEFFVDHNG